MIRANAILAPCGCLFSCRGNALGKASPAPWCRHSEAEAAELKASAARVAAGEDLAGFVAWRSDDQPPADDGTPAIVAAFVALGLFAVAATAFAILRAAGL